MTWRELNMVVGTFKDDTPLPIIFDRLEELGCAGELVCHLRLKYKDGDSGWLEFRLGQEMMEEILYSSLRVPQHLMGSK